MDSRLAEKTGLKVTSAWPTTFCSSRALEQRLEATGKKTAGDEQSGCLSFCVLPALSFHVEKSLSLVTLMIPVHSLHGRILSGYTRVWVLPVSLNTKNKNINNFSEIQLLRCLKQSCINNRRKWDQRESAPCPNQKQMKIRCRANGAGAGAYNTRKEQLSNKVVFSW